MLPSLSGRSRRRGDGAAPAAAPGLVSPLLLLLLLPPPASADAAAAVTVVIVVVGAVHLVQLPVPRPTCRAAAAAAAALLVSLPLAAAAALLVRRRAAARLLLAQHGALVLLHLVVPFPPSLSHSHSHITANRRPFTLLLSPLFAIVFVLAAAAMRRTLHIALRLRRQREAARPPDRDGPLSLDWSD